MFYTHTPTRAHKVFNVTLYDPIESPDSEGEKKSRAANLHFVVCELGTYIRLVRKVDW